MKNNIWLALGDCSGDGHEQIEYFGFICNKTKDEIIEAYKTSCKSLKISFSDSNYTEIKHDWQVQRKYEVATEWLEPFIHPETYQILKQHNCPFLNDLIDTTCPRGQPVHKFRDDIFYDFIRLLWWFISISLPTLIYEPISNQDVDYDCVLNGYRNDNKLQCQFGYALF